MSLLLLPYSWPSPYTWLYFSYSHNPIATALITSRLDYCNSLLYNIASKDIPKLQCVQNCLGRVVTPSPRFSHSVQILKSLHWTHVHACIIFILCSITYQTLSSGEHSYLFSMLSLAPSPEGSVYLVFTCCLFLGSNWCWHSCFICCCPYSLELTPWKC